ncbi:MAG: redoxin domain-containing protein [Hyphomicrobiaceae bacterium]|nr:redoxin domain-containing protein [Hyphomicrobiaceae bacterium]
MVGFTEKSAELKALGIKVVAASVDPLDKSQEVAAELDFPIGFEVTRDIADKLGSWWEDRRQIIQPSEFILNADNKVIASSYSDGPVARMLAEDVVRMVTHVENMKKKA